MLLKRRIVSEVLVLYMNFRVQSSGRVSAVKFTISNVQHERRIVAFLSVEQQKHSRQCVILVKLRFLRRSPIVRLVDVTTF